MLLLTAYDLNASRRQKLKEKTRILKEIKGRSLDGNQGGSRGKKLLTAYREDSLRTVALLEIKEVVTPKDLATRGLNKTLLQKNYYDWFLRIDRGKYTLVENIQIEEEFKIYLDIFRKEYDASLAIEKEKEEEVEEEAKEVKSKDSSVSKKRKKTKESKDSSNAKKGKQTKASKKA